MWEWEIMPRVFSEPVSMVYEDIYFKLERGIVYTGVWRHNIY